MKNKGFTLIELLIAIAIIGIFAGLIGGGTPNKGQHTGFVTAVEVEGIIWKTNRAYFKTNTQSSQEDKYCVIDPSIVSSLQDISSLGKQVTIQYARGFFVAPWNCGGEESIIVGVK